MADIAPDVSTFKFGDTPSLDISSFEFVEDRRKTTSDAPDVSEIFSTEEKSVVKSKQKD